MLVMLQILMLQEMSQRNRCEGIIQDAILLGTPVTGAPKDWQKLMRVVSGKIVNGYCRQVFLCCRFKEMGQCSNTYIHCHLMKSLILGKAWECLRYGIRNRCKNLSFSVPVLCKNMWLCTVKYSGILTLCLRRFETQGWDTVEVRPEHYSMVYLCCNIHEKNQNLVFLNITV